MVSVSTFSNDSTNVLHNLHGGKLLEACFFEIFTGSNKLAFINNICVAQKMNQKIFASFIVLKWKMIRIVLFELQSWVRIPFENTLLVWIKIT